MVEKQRNGPLQKAIDCKEGVLFTRPIHGLLGSYDYNKYNDNIRKLIPKNCNIRLSIILHILILEDKIARLRQIIDGKRVDIFDLEVENIEKGGFIGTCEYIDYFKLIPSHLLEISKRVYRIRNKFVHDLKCKNFNVLNSEYKNECNSLLESSKEFNNISDLIPFKKRLTKKILNKFIFLCDAGINSYLFAVHLWKKDQASRGINYYKQMASEMNDKEEKEILKSIPKISYESNLKIERYPKGLTIIGSRVKEKGIN